MSYYVISKEANMETWKDIPGHYGYQVSDEGRIRSKRKDGYSKELRDEWRILKGETFRSTGYRCQRLACDEGGYKTKTIHRLVMLAFVGPCPKGQQVRHKDGTRTNCRLDNLEYGTAKQNNKDDKDRDGTQLIGEKHHQCKLTEAQVWEIIALLKQGKSQSSIAKQYDVLQCHVNAINKGRLWGHLNKTYNFSPVKAHCGKMTPDDVRSVRRMLAEGVSSAKVAKAHNVSQSQVSRIKLGIDHRSVI
jgi:HNH endonuclease/NUMOD4 motif